MEHYSKRIKERLVAVNTMYHNLTPYLLPFILFVVSAVCLVANLIKDDVSCQDATVDVAKDHTNDYL